MKTSINWKDSKQLKGSILGFLLPYSFSAFSFSRSWRAAFLFIFISCVLRNSHQPSPLISLPLPLFCARDLAYDSLISVQWSGGWERTERNDRAGLMACISGQAINIQLNVSDNRAGGPGGTAGPDSLIKQLKWNDARSRRGSSAGVNSDPVRARRTQTHRDCCRRNFRQHQGLPTKSFPPSTLYLSGCQQHFPTFDKLLQLFVLVSRR